MIWGAYRVYECRQQQNMFLILNWMKLMMLTIVYKARRN
jgi:hypothetical protein